MCDNGEYIAVPTDEKGVEARPPITAPSRWIKEKKLQIDNKNAVRKGLSQKKDKLTWQDGISYYASDWQVGKIKGVLRDKTSIVNGRPKIHHTQNKSWQNHQQR